MSAQQRGLELVDEHACTSCASRRRLTTPSLMPRPRTIAITRSVRSIISKRSAVSMVIVSACTLSAPVTDVTSATGCSRTVTSTLGHRPTSSGSDTRGPDFDMLYSGQTTDVARRQGKWVRIPHGAATVSGESAFTAGDVRSARPSLCVERSTHGKTRTPASIRKSGYLVTGPSFLRRSIASVEIGAQTRRGGSDAPPSGGRSGRFPVSSSHRF